MRTASHLNLVCLSPTDRQDSSSELGVNDKHFCVHDGHLPIQRARPLFHLHENPQRSRADRNQRDCA
jgi:hypothetical protein